MKTGIYWFANTPRAELIELDFNTMDWFICLEIADNWYHLWLKTYKS
jgi:hypothetical protein